jgi:hypothetical protein
MAAQAVALSAVTIGRVDRERRLAERNDSMPFLGSRDLRGRGALARQNVTADVDTAASL